jgi:hypothetical protein
MSACLFDHDPDGRCCCNCKWQRPISGHPWNKTPAFYGRVTTVIAWGCTVPDMANINLSECEHGLCEVHDFKESTESKP